MGFFRTIFEGLWCLADKLFVALYGFIHFGAAIGLIFLVLDIIEMKNGVSFGHTKYFRYLICLYTVNLLICMITTALIYPAEKRRKLFWDFRSYLRSVFRAIFFIG